MFYSEVIFLKMCTFWKWAGNIIGHIYSIGEPLLIVSKDFRNNLNPAFLLSGLLIQYIRITKKFTPLCWMTSRINALSTAQFIFSIKLSKTVTAIFLWLLFYISHVFFHTQKKKKKFVLLLYKFNLWKIFKKKSVQ